MVFSTHLKLAFGIAFVLAIGLGAQNGPRTNGANLPVRTDANGYVIAAEQTYTGPDGPRRPFANTLVRTDANGYLIITNPSPFGTGLDHGVLTGLSDDDHTQYLLADGTRALTANWDAGAFLITTDLLSVGTSPPTLDTVNVDGSFLLTHTATGTEEHAMELIVDAASFGEVRALDIDYITGALAQGSDEAIILVNIDESGATGGDVAGLVVLATEGLAKIIGLEVGVLVDPIEQLSGTFSDAATVSNDGSVITTLNQGGAGGVAIFTLDDDFMIIGSGSKFEEIEYLLATGSSGAGIAPTFEFSTAIGMWTTFAPIDGTNAMRNSGVIAFLDSDIPSWATGAGTEFLIRITRTRNMITTPPVANKLQIAAATEYFWDKLGNIKSLTYESDIATGTAPLTVASTTLVSNLNADLLDGVQGAEFLQRDGSVQLTGDWSVGPQNIAFNNSEELQWRDLGGTPRHAMSVTVTDDLHIGDILLDSIDFHVVGVSPAMIIRETTGFVGIGTSAPATKLEVEDAGTATAIQISNTATDGDPVLAFALSGTATFTMGVDDGDGDSLKIGTSAIGTNTRLTIDSAGDVGIGTASPKELLHVGTGIDASDITATDLLV
ncbi:hypothetical protein LCGC14_0609730, partial [marine sediment metagenome]